MARGYDFSTAAGAEVEPLEAVGVSYECWCWYGDSTYFVVLGRGVSPIGWLYSLCHDAPLLSCTADECWSPGLRDGVEAADHCS